MLGKKLGVYSIVLILMLLACCAKTPVELKVSVPEEPLYSNPIDEYFLPRIEIAPSQAERSGYQDTYRGVWKSEFENIIRWADEGYFYQEYKDTLLEYVNSVEQLIATARSLWLVEARREFGLPPDDPDSVWGTGTRGALNQLAGEIYRDAGMRVIKNFWFREEYVFVDIDYSKEHYE